MDITGLGSAFNFAKDIVGRFFPEKMSEADKLNSISALVPIIEQRDNQVVESKKEIMVAELNQGDKYTKRARPTLIYVGLASMVLNNIILPFFIDLVMIFMNSRFDDTQLKMLGDVGNYNLPGEFWVAWGGAAGIYSIGRSLEKRGTTNKLISAITGN